jgi:hypothetical protein
MPHASREELVKLAKEEVTADGSPWPLTSSGVPMCDRCERDATRYSMPNPDSCVFFCDECDECDEHDPVEACSGLRQ